MNFFRKIGDFFSCLLQENCVYSIKKILAYAFSILIIYMAIFTDKEYYDLLFFVGGLLGVRAYERVQLWKSSPNEATPEPGLQDDDMLGSKKPANTNSKKQLLTD